MQISKNKINNVYSGFHYSTFSKIAKNDGCRIEIEVLPELGCGTQILYKVVDGMFITHRDYRYENIGCRKNNMFSKMHSLVFKKGFGYSPSHFRKAHRQSLPDKEKFILEMEGIL